MSCFSRDDSPGLLLSAMSPFLSLQAHRQIIEHSGTKGSVNSSSSFSIIPKEASAIVCVLALLVNALLDFYLSQRCNLFFAFRFTSAVEFFLAQ
jgi:hypothetical protein